ncbi:uncharacterized protein LOC135200586 [Macrobrachium nipponense]|uniref:uncharacterized protein LOC135200586 n=1 Tax=Macrobrachium nipponense TaxID=159736 RepID=UPI0030C7D3D8
MKKKQLLLSAVIPLALGVFSVTLANTSSVTYGDRIGPFSLPDTENVEIWYRKTKSETCSAISRFCFTLQQDSRVIFHWPCKPVECGTDGWSLIRILGKHIIIGDKMYDLNNDGGEQPLRWRTLTVSSNYFLEWKIYPVIRDSLRAPDPNLTTPQVNVMGIVGTVSGSLGFVLIVIIIIVLLRNRKQQPSPEAANNADQEEDDYDDVNNVNYHIYDGIENVVENIYDNPDYSMYC